MSEYKIFKMMKYATTKEPMTLADALESDNYCIQLKKDGASYILAKDLDGSAHLYKDSISKKTGKIIDKIENLPHVKKWIEDFFPIGSQLLAEICYGESSKAVNSIMLALPAKAISRQEQTKLAEVYIFDILFWDNKSVFEQDFAERWKKITDIAYNFEENTKHPYWVNFAITIYNNKAKAITNWLKDNEEGGVLKMLHSTKKTSAAYAVREIGQTAARPMNTTFKIKQIDSVDAVIMGIEMPTKDYTGINPETHNYRDENNIPVNRLWSLNYASALSIGLYDDSGKLTKIGTVSSGLNDEIRKIIVECPEVYIGTCIEVDCMSKDNKSKTLRHPRFMNFRNDKEPESCLMSEVFVQ